MASPPNKRSNMVLYADRESINSLRIKMIVAEKAAPADIIEINPQKLSPEFLALNPSGHFPVLVDRELVLYEPSIIAEYLDERFPHPPLLPVYPIARAKTRLMILRIEREWFTLAYKINAEEDPTLLKQKKKLITDSIISFMPVFSSLPYFLSEEFSFLDCCMAPLLWHLPKLGIELSSQYKAIHDYMNRIFQRPSFQTSLITAEDYETA